MTTILLVDTNYTFTADVESRLILNEIPDSVSAVHRDRMPVSTVQEPL